MNGDILREIKSMLNEAKPLDLNKAMRFLLVISMGTYEDVAELKKYPSVGFYLNKHPKLTIFAITIGVLAIVAFAEAILTWLGVPAGILSLKQSLVGG